MGSGKGHDMQEIYHSSSKDNWDKFYSLVDRFIQQGYSKVDEETEDEEGLGHEFVSKTTVVELKSPNYELPLVKLEGKETYGKYDYDSESFDEWDTPRFDLKAWKKGSRSENFNDRWELFDLG